LMTEGGELDAYGGGGVPDVFVGADLDRSLLSGWKDERHIEFFIHFFSVWEDPGSCMASRPDRSG